VLTIISYGKVSCLTKKEQVASSTYKVAWTGGESLDCVGTVSGCSYSQLTNTTGQPTITALSKGSDTAIVITGTDFVTADTATVFFQGISANSVVIDSATQVTATYTKGVPLTAAGAAA
jgi:hypothetical protein